MRRGTTGAERRESREALRARRGTTGVEGIPRSAQGATRDNSAGVVGGGGAGALGFVLPLSLRVGAAVPIVARTPRRRRRRLDPASAASVGAMLLARPPGNQARSGCGDLAEADRTHPDGCGACAQTGVSGRQRNGLRRERRLGLWEGCVQAVRHLSTIYWGGPPDPQSGDFAFLRERLAALNSVIYCFRWIKRV